MGIPGTFVSTLDSVVCNYTMLNISGAGTLLTIVNSFSSVKKFKVTIDNGAPQYVYVEELGCVPLNITFNSSLLVSAEDNLSTNYYRVLYNLN